MIHSSKNGKDNDANLNDNCYLIELDLDYLPWICQYSPSNCGNPDINENSTIIKNDFRIGNIITYQCAQGCRLDGLQKRFCQSNGFWQGDAPTCVYVDCGPLQTIPKGHVSYLRTDFNASATYSCIHDYALVGTETRYCLGNGSWSDQEPKCMYSLCTQPSEIDNGLVHVTNRTINGIATYSCHSGFVLFGQSQLSCQIGGSWSNNVPQCKCKSRFCFFLSDRNRIFIHFFHCCFAY